MQAFSTPRLLRSGAHPFPQKKGRFKPLRTCRDDCHVTPSSKYRLKTESWLLGRRAPRVLSFAGRLIIEPAAHLLGRQIRPFSSAHCSRSPAPGCRRCVRSPQSLPAPVRPMDLTGDFQRRHRGSPIGGPPSDHIRRRGWEARGPAPPEHGAPVREARGGARGGWVGGRDGSRLLLSRLGWCWWGRWPGVGVIDRATTEIPRSLPRPLHTTVDSCCSPPYYYPPLLRSA